MKPRFIAYAVAKEIHNNIMAVLNGKPQVSTYTQYVTRAGGDPIYHSSLTLSKPTKGMIPHVDGWSTIGSTGNSIVFTHKALDKYCTITVTPTKIVFSPYVFDKGNRVRIARLMKTLGMGDQLYLRMEYARYNSSGHKRTNNVGYPTRNDGHRVHIYSYMGKGKSSRSCGSRFAGDTIEYHFKTGGVVAVTPSHSSGRRAQFAMWGYNQADVMFRDIEQGISIPIPEFVDTVCAAITAIYSIGAQREAHERSKSYSLTDASTSQSAFIDHVICTLMNTKQHDSASLYRGIIKQAALGLLRNLQITHKQAHIVVYTPLEGDGLPYSMREYIATDTKLMLMPCEWTTVYV
jgi:hypothetical protein